MELNNIQLSSLQLAELYGNNLVATNPHATVEEPAPVINSAQKESPAFSYKGKNQKRLLWLVSDKEHSYLSDDAFRFLIQVLEACKLNLDDIALVNLHNCTESFEELVAALKPLSILASNVSPSFLSSKQELYTILSKDGYQLFTTAKLELVKDDKVQKSKLWLGLKQILGI
jgi:hypothetical protein